MAGSVVPLIRAVTPQVVAMDFNSTLLAFRATARQAMPWFRFEMPWGTPRNGSYPTVANCSVTKGIRDVCIPVITSSGCKQAMMAIPNGPITL